MERPGVGLAVILMKEPFDVLLGLRKGSHAAGKWAFPGGHLEKFEHFNECALKELSEETGLIVPQIRLVDSYSPCEITNDFFIEDDKHYITLYFRAHYISGEPKLMEPDKCERWEWFAWNNLPDNLMVSLSNLKKKRYNPF